MSISVNPLDWRTVLLAKHAQHVVLIHFPIALYLAGVASDFVARASKRDEFASVGYWNMALAAIFTLPVIATGIMAWQWQLQGQKLKGLLLYHLLLALMSSVVILATWVMQFRARRGNGGGTGLLFTSVEIAGVVLLILTGHLGGFLSGVNGAP